MTEKWKPLAGFAGYEISNHGRVRNRHGRVLKATFCSGGLNYVLEGYGVRVPRAVGKAFCPEFRDDLYPKYRDGNPRNCRADNLQWVPRSEITGVPYSRNRKRK